MRADILSLWQFVGRWSVIGFWKWFILARGCPKISQDVSYLDHFEELLWAVYRPDRESVQQLHLKRGQLISEGLFHIAHKIGRTHQTTEALECSWDADGRVDFDQNTFVGVNVYLQSASFVHRRIKKGEQTLNKFFLIQVSKDIVCF